MPRKKEPSLRGKGRPSIDIDWVEFDKLCAMQCTLEEIAAWFNCSVDTIENKVKEAHGVIFSEYYATKRNGGKVSLRRAQWKTAMSGNVVMQIFLGKNYLNQSDKVESKLEVNTMTDDELLQKAKEIL